MNNIQIRQVLVFLIFLILISYGLDKGAYYLFNKTSDKVFSGQTIGKLNHYLKVKDTTDILVFGSSRANHHIDVARFSESSFNTGLDGVRIAYAATLIKLLPENRPQTVILHLDGYGHDYTGEDIARLKVKYHRNELIRGEIDKIEQQTPLQNIFWCLDYNGSVCGIIKNLIHCDTDYLKCKGFFPLDVYHDTKEVMAESMLFEEDSEDCIEVTELNGLVLAYIDDVCEFCKKNNKRFLVITTPKYREKCLHELGMLQMYLNNKCVEYYDFTNLFDHNYPLGYWKDQTHLSALGAAVFTEHLRATINLGDP